MISEMTENTYTHVHTPAHTHKILEISWSGISNVSKDILRRCLGLNLKGKLNFEMRELRESHY
jgi:hypothetical protein